MTSVTRIRKEFDTLHRGRRAGLNEALERLSGKIDSVELFTLVHTLVDTRIIRSAEAVVVSLVEKLIVASRAPSAPCDISTSNPCLIFLTWKIYPM